MDNEVYITDPGTRIVTRKGTIIIMSRNGNKQVLPPNVEEIIIATSRASITSKAIGILSMKGINLVFLNSFGDPVALMLPPVINKTVMTRVKQYETFLNNESRLELARRLIACKIENQARLVRYFAKSRREQSLNDIAYSISSMATQLMSIEINRLNPEVIEGIEAQAANRYWDAVVSLVPSWLGFHGRDPEGTDSMNLALNYGYGILYSTMERYLITAGLDPYLGVLHTIKSGKPSLVFDTVEVFRPVAVDRALIVDMGNTKLSIINGFLDYDSRRAIARIILNNLNRDYINPRTGRKSPLTEIMKHEAWYLASVIRDDAVKNYECFTWVF